MALKSETASPPNGMVNVINQESGGCEDDLEDGEIFDDDEDLPVAAAAASSPPAPPPPPTISLDDKRRLSPLRRPPPNRPRRLKRPRDDDRSFRNSKQRRRSDENEKREKLLDDDDLLRDISPLRGPEWDRVHHRSNFLDDVMDEDDDEFGRRGRGFGSSRPRRGRNNRGVRRGMGGGGGGGRRENTQICKFFAQGKCQRGSECPFSHNQQNRKFELCKFYMMDCCAKKDKCLFMHAEFPCKYNYQGRKCYAGKKCKFSHGKISSQLRAALLRDSKECDFLQEKEEVSRPRRDRDRDREREKDREHREHRERDKREDKDRPPAHVYSRHDPKAASDEEGNRTPMPSPPQDSISDRFHNRFRSRDSRSRTPEIEEHHSDHSYKSDIPLPDPKVLVIDSGISDDIPDTIPPDLPKMQRELYKRIQQQQREVESVQSEEGNEERDEDYKEEDWYSSEDEDNCKKMEPLDAILKKLKQKSHIPTTPPSNTVHQSSTTPGSEIVVPPILPDIDINAVSKLLSSVRETIQQKQNIENQNKAQAVANSAIVPSLGNLPSLPPLGSLVPDALHSLEKRRVRDPRLRGNVADDDVDLRMAPQGDVDLRQLPFKPAPVHSPANEIDASIASHPPVPYKLVPFIIAPPDYSDITSKFMNDPRLKRNNPGAMAILQPALLQQVPALRPPLEIRDPRQRGLLANDPRRKSSVLLQRDSDLRQPPQHFAQLGDIDLRMHPPTPHLAFK